MPLRYACFVILAAACAAPGAAAVETPEWPGALFPDTSAFGVVVHTPFKAEALHDVNVQWVRVSVRWRKVEVDARGNYDWADTDELLNYYLDNGFRVLCVLTMETLCPLYEEDKENQDMVIGAIARWCGATAARYAGKGILWELGNEPEVFPMGGYWNDPVTYTRMARHAARAIKDADARAKVAALSVAWMDRGFVETALKEGLLADKTVDVLTYHGYHRHTLLPESGLAEDVGWLRGKVAEHVPEGHHVIVADSERGYAIIPFLDKKSWDSWRNLVYSESEQAAYCARHYLETLYLGVEIAVWYKDMRGEHAFSLYYDTEESGLRPMGYVYRNLASLFTGNPKSMRNDRYDVRLGTVSHEEAALELRSYLCKTDRGERLIVAVWNPVEAFDGRLLDNRKRIGNSYYEAWRATSEKDIVEVQAAVEVSKLEAERIVSVQAFDLLSASTTQAYEESEWHSGPQGNIEIPVSARPMPALVIIEIK